LRRTQLAAGKAAGVLMANRQLAQTYLDASALFVAVGVDTTLLVQAASALAQQFNAGNACLPIEDARSASPY
jgi:4-hydroxy-2-oxoheptanedioate aldolase